jgi:hypothetical protein
MKTKSYIILLIALVAVITLSFTFVSASHGDKEPGKNASADSAPIGGIAIEDKL